MLRISALNDCTGTVFDNDSYQVQYFGPDPPTNHPPLKIFLNLGAKAGFLLTIPPLEHQSPKVVCCWAGFFFQPS